MSTRSDKEGADKDLPDEQQLEEYLRGGSDVSRQYRQLHSAEVPAALDRLVLRQAQEAVKAQPAKSRKWMRWTGPLALAASAVLVISIVIESGVNEETYVAAPVSAPVEQKLLNQAAEPGAAGSAADKRAEDAGSAERHKAAGVANDASVVHVMPMDSPPPISDVLLAPIAPAPTPTPAPAPAAAEQAFAIQPTAPAPTAARASAPAPQSAPPAEEVTVQAYKLQRQDLSSSSVAMPVMAEERDSSVEEVAITGARQSEQKQTAGPRNTVAAPRAGDSKSNAAEDQADAPRNYSDPEQWLRDIRELRKAKKHDEADREWRRFRYVFPNYEVAGNDLARGALR